MRARWAGAAFGLLIAVADGATALAQQPNPSDAVDRFLSLNVTGQLQSAEGRGLRIGEASAWDVPSIGPLPNRHDRLLVIDDRTAVARIEARPPDSDPVDLYFYLRQSEQGWQVSAMRTLALPQFIFTLIAQLEARPDRTSEDDAMLENLRLITRPDAELHRWFDEHRAAIEALAEAYEELPAGSGPVREDDEGAPQVSAALRSLHLSQISRQEGRLVLLIGGMLDNSVGLMRTASPPSISTTEYIWVEPLAEGWFLFKTT